VETRFLLHRIAYSLLMLVSQRLATKNRTCLLRS